MKEFSLWYIEKLWTSVPLTLGLYTWKSLKWPVHVAFHLNNWARGEGSVVVRQYLSHMEPDCCKRIHFKIPSLTSPRPPYTNCSFPHCSQVWYACSFAVKPLRSDYSSISTVNWDASLANDTDTHIPTRIEWPMQRSADPCRSSNFLCQSAGLWIPVKSPTKLRLLCWLCEWVSWALDLSLAIVSWLVKKGQAFTKVCQCVYVIHNL